MTTAEQTTRRAVAPDGQPRLPIPSIGPLWAMTDTTGIQEHSLLAIPDRRHGYATDDNGRALAVVCTLAEEPTSLALASTYLAFLVHARLGGGHFRLRMSYDRRWSDAVSDDASGRAILGLGTAAATARWPQIRNVARRLFEQCGAFGTTSVRATAYAALGAAAVATSDPSSVAARQLLARAAHDLPMPSSSTTWPWPEPRLHYANALLPEALYAVGIAQADRARCDAAMELLTWLVEVERGPTGMSFVGTDGWSAGQPRPCFDQQPIEAGAMASACARLARYEHAPWMRDTVIDCARWFAGRNDTGAAMWDPVTGRAYDGLERDGVNLNEGAESTLEFLSTLHLADAASRQS